MSDDFASQLTPNDLNLDVTVFDGKYRVTFTDAGRLLAYRYPAECPEIWRDLTGDGLVLALAQEVANLRARIKSMETEAQHDAWERDSR